MYFTATRCFDSSMLSFLCNFFSVGAVSLFYFHNLIAACDIKNGVWFNFYAFASVIACWLKNFNPATNSKNILQTGCSDVEFVDNDFG